MSTVRLAERLLLRLRDRRPPPPLGDRLDASARRRIDEALAIASERLQAADLLARAPHRAEGIQVLARAARALEAACADLREALPAGAQADVSRPEAAVRLLRAAREELEAAPALDARLSRDHLRAWRRARGLARQARRHLQAITRRQRAAQLRRAAVALGALVAAAVAVAGLRAFTRLHDRFEVRASGFYGSDRGDSAFAPDSAVDGDATTEWLTPGGAEAWLDVRFAGAIDVAAVRLVNAHNPPHNDRAAKEVEVQLYRGDRLERTARVQFDKIETAGAAPRTVDLSARDVTRVRLLVVSHHGVGGGLAEIEVLEKAPAPAPR